MFDPDTGGLRTSPHQGQHSPFAMPADHDPMLLSPQQKLSPTGNMGPQVNPQGLISPGSGFSPQNNMAAAQQQRPMHLPVGNQQGYGMRQTPQGFNQEMAAFQQGALHSPGAMPPGAAKQQLLQSPGGTMPGVMQGPGGRVQHHNR